MTDKSLRRPYPPKIVTANALMEGDVVYFTANRSWSRDIGDALAVHNADTADRLLAEANMQAGEIVGAYLADVTLESGRPAPIHFREAFRTRGPSNYFHGKQEAGAKSAAYTESAQSAAQSAGAQSAAQSESA